MYCCTTYINCWSTCRCKHKNSCLFWITTFVHQNFYNIHINSFNGMWFACPTSSSERRVKQEKLVQEFCRARSDIISKQFMNKIKNLLLHIVTSSDVIWVEQNNYLQNLYLMLVLICFLDPHFALNYPLLLPHRCLVSRMDLYWTEYLRYIFQMHYHQR